MKNLFISCTSKIITFVIAKGNVIRIPSFSLHMLLQWACRSLWDIVWTLSLDKCPNPQLAPVPELVFILSPTLGCPFSHDRLQLGDELLLFGIHHCILFSCHQGLLVLLIPACHRLVWSLSSCVSHQKKRSSRFRCLLVIRTANAPAFSPCDVFCGGC